MEEPDRSLSAREFVRALRTGKWWILGISASLMLAAAAVTSWVRPVYQSEVLLQFERPESSGGLLGQLGPLSELGLGGLGGDDDLETQLGVLESRHIAESVVDSLQLNVQLLAPRAPRDSVLRVLEAGDQQFASRYTLTLRPDGAYDVEVDGSDRPVEASASASVGVPFRLGATTLSLLETAGEKPEEIVVAVQPLSEVVARLRDDIEVAPGRGGSRLVEVSYRSPDRLLAAAVPNAVTAVFTDYQYRTSTGDSRRKVEVLREQVAVYAAQLRTSEEMLRRYRESAQVIAPESQVSEQVRRLSAVMAERDGRAIERASLQRLLAEMRSGASSADYRALGSFPAFVAHAGVQGILESLTQLENQRAELVVLRNPQNRDVQGIDQRIAELEQQLYRYGTSYVEGLDDQIASANTFLSGFESELATVPAREVGYHRLLREAELLNQIYAYLQTRLKEAEITEATELGKVRVIDSALSPRNPISPKPLINIALAGFIGLMLGSAVAVGRRLTDSRVQGAEEAEAAAGVPVLEVIPAYATNGHAESWFSRRRSASAAGNGQSGAAGRMDEQYDSLLLSVFGASRPRTPAVLLLSSTTANDGRSATVLNLGAALARKHVRTVLVDADLRDGVLHRSAGVARAPGLIEVLRGTIPLEAAIQPVELPGVPAGTLFLLARGGDLPVGASELLGGDDMRALLTRLRGDFGAVLLDTPPVNNSSDAVLLRPAVDAMLLVAETGSTEKQSLHEASRRLRHLDAPVQGIVLHAPAARPALANIRISRVDGAGSR